MDPLSDVLALLKPKSYVSLGLDAGPEWAIDFPPPQGIKFNAVLSGDCWLEVDGVAEPVRLREGDCFLLTQSRPFRMMSHRGLLAIPAHDIYAHARDGIATCNGGGAFFLVGSRFGFSGAGAELLVGILPPVVHISEHSDQASVLRFAIDQMARELRGRHPGGFLMTEHLAHIMLTQILRLYLSAPDTAGTGWLFALADRQIGTAIGAMHAEPARRWTLQQLAALAGMSRSSFAERFRDKVGAAPMDYLTRWRMMLASERLTDGREPIGTIALSLGYESESAFSTAFKRVMARSPRQYGRETASRADGSVTGERQAGLAAERSVT